MNNKLSNYGEKESVSACEAELWRGCLEGFFRPLHRSAAGYALEAGFYSRSKLYIWVRGWNEYVFVPFLDLIRNKTTLLLNVGV
jgi:hypothetical protein